MKKLLLCHFILATVCFAAHAKPPLVERVRPMSQEKPETPLAYPTRTTEAPKIDGKLDDACWKTAARIGPMRVSATGDPATEDSTGFICFDDEALYVGVEAVEAQIDHLVGRANEGREDRWDGDEMEFFIAPHGDGAWYYQFAVGAKFGQRFDFSSDKGQSYHDKAWLSAVTLDKARGRWYTEVKIPFAAFGLKAPTADVVWGFNLGRRNDFTEAPAEAWANLGSQELTQWSPTGLSFRNVARFGRLYFGTPEQLAKLREPLNVELILDRHLYDNLDGHAQGIVVVRPGGRELDELQINLALKQGTTLINEQSLARPVARSASFLVPIDQLAPGKYTLEATVESGSAQPATATRAFDRVDKGLADGVASKGRVPLKLPARDPAQRGFAWPVRTGVPMPKGALNDPTKAQLLVNGRPAPCQTSVRGRWSPNGSIRWLGLTFVATDPAATYELEYGGDAAPAPSQPVTIQDGVVSTGPLRFRLDKGGITEAWINDKQVVAATDSAAPYVVDETGKRYSAAWSDDVKVEVEEAGPVHAVVRVSGWFAAKDGAKLCKFTTYYEAFAGLPHVFVDHAVIITYDTRHKKLRDIGFPVAATGKRYAIGIDDGKALTGARTTRVTAVQDRWDHFVAQAADQHEGRRLSAWADAGDADLGVTLTAQYVPERYPKQFSVDEKHLTYHLWPSDLGNTFSDAEELAYENIYKLLSAHEGPALDLQMPQRYFDKGREYHAAGQTFTLGYAKDGIKISNGQGVAINEPFAITFRDRPLKDAEAAAFAKLFEQDPHAVAEPKWIAKSEVFGPLPAVDRERYPQMANYLGRSFLAMCFPVVRDGKDYGMFNFGDVHTYFDMIDQPPRAPIHRVWLNHHHSHNPLAWELYAYYGEPQYLEWARVSSRHTMNIDVCHYADPAQPLMYHQTGAFYHVKGFVHWGGDSGFAQHLVSSSYLQWAWAWTGNRRARDVANEWIEGLLAEAADGYGTRDGETTLGEITTFYQNDWDPRVLRTMHGFAQALLAEALETQGDTNWNPQTFVRYYGLTRDPLALERIRSPGFRNNTAPQTNAYLYLVTGDESYLEGYDNVYERIRAQYDNPDDIYDGMVSYSFLNAGRQIPELMLVQKAFEKAGRTIRPDMKRARPGIIETGPYDRESPRQYTLGVLKVKDQAITLDAGADPALGGKIEITGPDGNRIEAIDAKAPEGLYTVFVKAGKPIKVSGGEPFFVVKAGKEYGLLQDTLASIAPLDGNGPIRLQFRAGDKHAVRLTILDSLGNDVVTASSWYRREGKLKSLTIPAGGPYRIIAPYPTTIVADRDLKLVPHVGNRAGGAAKPDVPTESADD